VFYCPFLVVVVGGFLLQAFHIPLIERLQVYLGHRIFMYKVIVYVSFLRGQTAFLLRFKNMTVGY
jgi:hypothetical protein